MKLGEYVKFQNGYAFKSKDFVETGKYKVIKIKEIKDGVVKFFSDTTSIDCVMRDDFDKYLVFKGDVLFALTGDPVNKPNPLSWVGRVAIYLHEEPALLNQRVCKLLPSKDVNAKYIYYYFRQFEHFYDLASKATGSASQANISTKLIESVDIDLPERIIQDKIVEWLDSISEKIEINKKINENLEQQVSVLYNSWFEDFELTNGVCPENWCFQELSTIADIASGKRPPVKSEVCNQETPFSIVGAASVMGFTSEANHTDKILVTGRVGTHGVIQRFNTPCWTSDNTLVITSPYYEFTNQILHRIDYSSMNRGSTQPLITQGDMKKIVVLVPDEDTLAKFEEFAGSLMAKWEVNSKENVKLASLRDTLLPRLMSGELDVSDIEL